MLMNEPLRSAACTSLRAARLSGTFCVVTTVYFLNFDRLVVSRLGSPYPPNDARMMGLSVGILRILQTSARVRVACRAMNGMSLTFEKLSNPRAIGSFSAIDALA